MLKRLSSGYRSLSLSTISSVVNFFFITLHGLPTAIEYGGIDLVTTEPAPIIDPRPIVTPGITVTLIPIQTSSSMTVSDSLSPNSLQLHSTCHLLRGG